MDEPPDGVDHAEAVNRDSRPVTIDGDTVTRRARANAATIHGPTTGAMELRMASQRGRRGIHVFLDAYADLPAFDVAEAVITRMHAVNDLVSHLAELGQEPQRTWVAHGALERNAIEIAWVREHRADFT